jgi:hypothetical protein
MLFVRVRQAGDYAFQMSRQHETRHDRGIALPMRHAHTTNPAAAAVVNKKVGFLASAAPSAAARQMCAAKIRANTVPVVIT